MLQLSLTVLLHERNAFTWSVNLFFHARTYLPKVSPRDLKCSSIEAEWLIDIIK